MIMDSCNWKRVEEIGMWGVVPGRFGCRSKEVGDSGDGRLVLEVDWRKGRERFSRER